MLSKINDDMADINRQHHNLHKENCTPSSLLTNFKKGFDFLLEHFETNNLFPRRIMTNKLGYQKKVFSKEEAFAFYKDSNFIDCRINAFPAIENTVPDFIFIDLDETGTNTSLDKRLDITLTNIRKRLDGYPTVLWTGNGYHVYQPIDCPMKLKNIEEFGEFDNPDLKFLRFEQKSLSDGYADIHSNPSFRSCLLRIPGSLNSKCLHKGLDLESPGVQIIQQWDHNRPSIGNQMGSFYAYLISEKISKQKDTKQFFNIYTKNKPSNEIQWIEKLLKTPLRDHRKYCLWRILIPYLVNIKRLSDDDIILILEKWCKESNKLRQLDFDPRIKIKEQVKHVKKYLPISKDNLEKENPDIYYILAKN